MTLPQAISQKLLLFLLLLIAAVCIASVTSISQRLTVYAVATACDGQTLNDVAQADDKAGFSQKYCNDDPNAMCEAAYAGWVQEHEQDLKNKGLYDQYCKGGSNNSNNNGSPSNNTPSGSSSSLPSCGDDPAGANRPANFYWKANCSSSCKVNSDCPKSSSPNVNADSSAWCFQFKDGNHCMQLEYKDGTSQKDFINYNNSSTPQPLACEEGRKTYFDSKVATRLALYYAILQGIKETCVKADLGVPTPPNNLVAKGVSGKEGRLFLCSGADSKAGSLDLKWRVDPGTGLEQVENPPGTDVNNLINKEHVKKAEQMLNTSAPTAPPPPPSSSGSCTKDSDYTEFAGCVPNVCGKEVWKCPGGGTKESDSPADGDCRKPEVNSACK